MPAGVFDFPINQGETFYYEINLLGQTEDDVIDLTGYTAEMQIRRTADSTEIMATPEVKIKDATNGIISIFLPATETAKLPCTGQHHDEYLELVYDIYIKSGTYSNTQFKTRILNGFINVSPNVTR